MVNNSYISNTIALCCVALGSQLLSMPIVDLVTLAMETRDLYPIALQVHSPVSQMMLTMPLPLNVATKFNCKPIIFITSESQGGQYYF